jgi:hypothetical protein
MDSQQAQAEPEAAPEETLDFDYSQDYDQTDPAQVEAYISKIAEAKAQELLKAQLNPFQERIGKMETEAAAQQLVQEFPRLAEPEVAEKVIKMSSDIAQQLGHPELANNPQLWKYAYLSQDAIERHNAEAAAQPDNAVTLEGAGGATLGGSNSEDDLISRILTPQHAGRSVLPFG